MTTSNSQTANNIYLKSLVDYVLEVKPYHTKLIPTGAVAANYNFSDSLNVVSTENNSSTILLGADLISGSNSLTRAKFSNTWYNKIVSDGTRLNWKMPLISNPRLSSIMGVNLFTIGTDDYTGIPGLTHGALNSQYWNANDAVVVKINGIHAQDTVDYNVSHGVSSFTTSYITGTSGNLQWISTENNYGATPTYQSGVLTYNDVYKKAGHISAITGQTYEEFLLVCVSNFPAVLNVYSTADLSTVLGSVTRLNTFTLLTPDGTQTRISFYFGNEYDLTVTPIPETANVGDTFLITPAAGVTIAPTSTPQTWSLIKCNPTCFIPGGEPKFIPLNGVDSGAAIEVNAVSLENSPASTWSVVFNANETITIISTLPGYPVNVDISSKLTYEDSNIKFTLIPSNVPWVSGDKFVWTTGATPTNYLVYGSIDGFQAPAQVGTWYWNGQIGFKIPKLLSLPFQTVNDMFTTTNAVESSFIFSTVLGVKNQNIIDIKFVGNSFFAFSDKRAVAGYVVGTGWSTDINAVLVASASTDLLVTQGKHGLISTSADGNVWIESNSGIDVNLNKSISIPNFLASPGSLTNDLTAIIIVGDSGTVLTSTDGLGWASQVTGTYENLKSIAYGAGLIVAVGTNGVIITSPDRINWTVANSGITSAILDISYSTTGGFLAVGEKCKILHSIDGITWTSISPYTTADYADMILHSVAQGASEAIIVGSSGFTISVDYTYTTWVEYYGKYVGAIAAGQAIFVGNRPLVQPYNSNVYVSTPSAISRKSSYTIEFYKASNSSASVNGLASVYNNLTGFLGNLETNVPWTDGIIDVKITSSTTTEDYSVGSKISIYLIDQEDAYSIYQAYPSIAYDEGLYDSDAYDGTGTTLETFTADFILNKFNGQDKFPLTHSFNSIIMSNVTTGDVVNIDKSFLDRVRLIIDGSSTIYPILGAVNDEVPIFYRAFNALGAEAVYPDLAVQLKFYTCTTGQLVFTINSPATIGSITTDSSILEFDNTFMSNYLPAGMKFTVITQPSAEFGQVARVNVSETIDIASVNIPSTSPPVLMLLGGGAATRTLVPFLADTSALLLGNLQFDSVTVYQADSATNFSGCGWITYIATTDPTLAGTSISPTPPSPPVDVIPSLTLPLTWKLVSNLIGTQVAAGTNIPLTNNGANGSSIDSEVLFTDIGFTTYDNSGFLIVATLRNIDTNETWTATALADTCS